MDLSKRLAKMLIVFYRNFNRTGILNYAWAQSVFVFCYFFYKRYIEDAYAELINKHPELFRDGHILDVGANIGYTAYLFSKMIKTPYRVFVFEPEKRNVAILKKVAKTYRFADQLHITAAAVGDKNGELELWQNDGHHADHRVLTDELRKQLSGAVHIQKIPVVTIDRFLQVHQVNEPIAFIKIDVQGYELAVCQGMIETLSANPNCVIAFEYCPRTIELIGYNADDLLRFFADKNYFFYRLNKNGSLSSLNIADDFSHAMRNDIDAYFDIICSRRKLIGSDSR